MTNQVFTETVCSSCGVKNKREGVKDYQPVGWWKLNFTRTDGDAWFKYFNIEKIVCPECAVPILKIIREEVCK